MQRSLVLSLVVLLLGLLGAAWFFLRNEPTLPAPGPQADAPLVLPAGPAAATVGGTQETGGAHPVREAVANRNSELLEDPEIRAGLCGFKGRVVTYTKTPVADCGVRMYRGAMDSILPTEIDLLAPETTYAPNYLAGEVRTATDGTWQLTGVWPRAFYLMFAGIGTDAPVHQLIARSPSPGEIVDLGDIVLPNAGVIVGTVLDDNGEPLAGALVRAADLPGTLAAFFPVERFDPEGAVLVREIEFPLKVVMMPPWVKNVFENLPIPTTRSDGEGHFRLVGVTPGSNLLATTAKGFLSDMKASVQVRAGQEKDVGKVRLKRGEELNGKVLDGAGKPVADAEVLAGSTIGIAPFDLAQVLGRSDAEGRFTGQGFAPGKVTVAARRGAGHEWVLAEPQSILGQVVITLPTVFAIDATVALADGKPAKDARLKLIVGRAGRGGPEMHLMGLSPAIDLRDRKKEVAEGHWRIENLAAGWYTLIADAPGHATSCANVEITASDATAAIALTAPSVFAVRVLDPQDKPVRNASIYANARGSGAIDMPVLCGRTGADGKLAIDKLQGTMLRVSADHPKWGVVHGEVKVGQELVLTMLAPGTLHGVVRENGKPPEPGKFSVSVERRGDRGRGAIEMVPTLLTPGLDGTFAAQAMQPGEYSVAPVKALEALRSPGGIFALAQEAMLARDLPREQVQIVSGQTTEVVLEVGEKPIEGPTAHLSGSVTIDGRLGGGSIVTVNMGNQRFTARVDERGRFDFAVLPAGDVRASLMSPTDGVFIGPENNLWAAQLKLTEGENKELAIEILTGSISGVCVDATGEPASNLNVQANGIPKGSDGHGGNVFASTTTGAQGEFTFAKLAEGKWTLTVRGGGRGRGAQRGQTDPFEVTGGVPVTGVRILVQPATVLKGRVDLSAFAGKKTNWIWMSCHRLAEGDASDAPGTWATGVGVDKDKGSFSTSDLVAGRYRFRLYVQLSDDTQSEYPIDVIVLPPSGLADVVLRPGPRVQR